ncbi:MAG: heparan-alpha-glucosaminide N-acetyltransferase domain-containing protein [Bacteroidota bacterium]
MKTTKKRILGLDFARSLAIIGMIIVNFKTVFGGAGDGLSTSFAALFTGRAAALFVVLAGVGIALMSKRSYSNKDDLTIRRNVKSLIFKRAGFLFVIGLLYLPVWPADILHFYGVYMVITLLVLWWKPRRVLLLALGVVLFYPIFLVFGNYDTDWDFSNLDYQGFWTVTGFLRNLFLNGFHPVFPWVAFMLAGVWLGRQPLEDKRFVQKLGVVSVLLFLLILLTSFGLQSIANEGLGVTYEDANLLFGCSPMPPLPIYMLNGIFCAFSVIAASILILQRWPDSFILNSLVSMGKMALTFYVAHVVIGMGFSGLITDEAPGGSTSLFSVSYALVFSFICWLFTLQWRQYSAAGPLEWLMRKLTG